MARKNPNKINIKNSYAEIEIYNKNNEIIALCLIDIEDVIKVKDKRWSLYSHGYVESWNNGDRISLHRFLMNCPPELEIDHKNQNKLDNRKENLRYCTHLENNRNKKTAMNNTSGYKGISWNKQRNHWRIEIYVNNKRIYLGSTKDIIEAIKIKKDAEEKYYGEFRSDE